jgi:hypothetical protein
MNKPAMRVTKFHFGGAIIVMMLADLARVHWEHRVRRHRWHRRDLEDRRRLEVKPPAITTQ